MGDSFFLAWRYLAYHRLKTLALIVSIATILYVPSGLQVVVGQAQSELKGRARGTPLIVGARGSQLDLVLNSLYFETEPPPSMKLAEVDRVRDSGLAAAIPLHTEYRAQEHPIIGTSLEYFEFRRLNIANGRQMAMLGECVVGARVARKEGLQPGDTLMSTSENPFDLAGVYPLKMHVVGVLAPTGTPDDRSVFVDLKTTWIIAGLGHGHQDLQAPEASEFVLDRTEDTITANPAVISYMEVTPNNVDSFHFHGDPADFPIHALIAVPHDEKSATVLRGRYLNDSDPAQIIIPSEVMDGLFETVLTIRTFIIAAAAIVSLATIVTVGMVFGLSLRLRKREIETMNRIGCSRLTIASLVGAEMVVVFLGAVTVAGVTTLMTAQVSSQLIRWFIL